MEQPRGFTVDNSIVVVTRYDRSWSMFVLQKILRRFRTLLVTPRKTVPAGSPRLDPPKTAKRLCQIQERKVEDIYIYDLIPKAASSDQSTQDEQKHLKRVYYFAGGGWQMPASSEHWAMCAELAANLKNTTISLVSYPLAPVSPAEVAIPKLMTMYHTLLRDAAASGEQVVLAGDSAGGNIVLCLTLIGLSDDEGAPCPSTILAISPSTDLRRHNPEIKAIEKHDPLLQIPFINSTAKAWRGTWDAADPRITPLTADISALARRNIKVHGVTGRYDILSPDALLFREKCSQAGVRGEWLDWDKQMHCFPLPFRFKLPESVQAKDWIIDVLRRS